LGLSFLYYDVTVMLYPDYFVSYLDHQFSHDFNWNGDLPIGSYFANLNDAVRHCAPYNIEWKHLFECLE